MARPPLYDTSMTRIVKFRVTEIELSMLRELKDENESISEYMRTLIRDAHERAQ